MAYLSEMVESRLDKGETVYMDSFGVEWVEWVEDTCRACDGHYRRTHGGWGSICFSCEEPWTDEEDDDV